VQPPPHISLPSNIRSPPLDIVSKLIAIGIVTCSSDITQLDKLMATNVTAVLTGCPERTPGGQWIKALRCALGQLGLPAVLLTILLAATPAQAQIVQIAPVTGNSFDVTYPGNSVVDAAGTGSSATSVPVYFVLLNSYIQSTLNAMIAAGNSPASASSQPYPFLFLFNGQSLEDITNGTVPGSYANGPNLNVSNYAALILNNPSFPQVNGTLIAQSYGAPGYPETKNGAQAAIYNAGFGGDVNVTNSGSITANGTTGPGQGSPWTPYLTAISGYSGGGQGAGAKADDNDFGGNGGNGGLINVTTSQGSSIILQGAGSNGASINGITAQSQGGAPGCDCSGDHPNVYGASGTGGAVTVNHNGSITSTAANSIGIVAVSIGGDGGIYTGHGVGSSPGLSGSGGAVDVNLGESASINLATGSSIGILAASSVGLSANSSSNSSITGGPVTVTVNLGASIASIGNGTFNIGVAAISTGSPDILQPFAANTVTPNGSGYSGSVTVTNYGSITTIGQSAAGIAALSLGGDGVFTQASSGVSNLGNAGSLPANAQGGSVTVYNGGTITTTGASAFGILAGANGAGGLINAASNATFSGGSVSSGVIVGAQNASNNGSGGNVSVTNAGTITTGDGNGGGKLAIGILAQSIGGGGGSIGGSGAAAFVGDQGGSGGNGGAVSVTANGGQITTKDDGALGILAQSVGGGGGNGGNAAGIFVAVGGEGGNGGYGNTVTISLGNGGVTTAGDFAAGTVAQSIGGGGGNGGYAKSYGAFISAAIGGTGGGGGNGGAVNFTNIDTITTTGEQSLGLLAQSVGGGGGSGGAANTYVAGAIFAASVALGGSGGGGGYGGQVNFSNEYHVFTSGPDSIGIVAQSIGGGGGNGGSALAKSLAVAGDPEIPTISLGIALGGSGGSGGSGGNVSVSNIGEIFTTGDGAHGILAQSIGGGGGNGGDSTAAALAIEGKAPTFKASVALGGSGGVSGGGGTVDVTSSSCNGCVSSISTAGNNAAGIVAQSVGGGGGNGGAGNASTSSPNLGGTTGIAISGTYAMGGTGGASGAGSSVTVSNLSGAMITSIGSGSQGILAQSIGAGGGDAGGGTAAGSGDNLNVNVSVGAQGGGGGGGGAVTVTNAGSISTGHNYQLSNGTVFTAGGDGIGILAQSVGGGGGVAGSSDAAATINTAGQIEDALNAPANSYSANVSVGGKGGAAASGGSVQVTNSGSIATLGIRAYGIEAQSIGGGGGSGGAATSAANSVLGGASVNDEGKSVGNTYGATVAVGGYGGASGNGGAVTITSAGSIMTAGYGAHGILAQSIGGGGGVGAEGSVNNTTTIGLGAGVNGNGGASGGGGNINVTTNAGGTITTLGDDAAGILGQSIGGGGGVGSAGCSNSTSAGVQGVSASSCFGNSKVGVGGNVAPWNDASSLTLNVGGNASASGNALDVIVNVSGAIATTGARSMGIVAQSIGGGGGFASAAAQNLSGTAVAASAGSNDSTGAPVTVTLAPSGSITTSGAGGWGILAQSIGGGGGFSGDPSLALLPLVSNTLSATGSGNAFANTVDVTLSGNITTTGANAHGVVAQSIGGSGGIVAGCCYSTTASALAGNTAQFRGGSNATYYGDGGSITITQDAGSTIRTSGPGSIGMIAQSSGNSSYTSKITVTIGGVVIGGTNIGSTGGVGAAGILLSGGAGANSTAANTVTVNLGGAVGTMDGVHGTAISAGDGVTNVLNSGTIAGSINLNDQTGFAGRTPGTITNNPGGVLDSGATLVASTLTNNGTLNLPGFQVSLTGSFVQGSGGKLTVPYAPSSTASLAVSGSATLQGTITPLVGTRFLPGTQTLLTAQNPSVSATVTHPLLFEWSLQNTGNAVSLSPVSNFAPAAASLSSNEASLAGYLTQAWGNADPALGSLFAALYNDLPAGGGYKTVLDQLSPRATQVPVTVLADLSSTVLGSAMSCPQFEGDTTLIGEGRCVWAKTDGQVTSEYAADGTVTSSTYRIGGQGSLSPNVRLGVAFGAGVIWADEGGGSKGSGQTFDGSVALKYTAGPWLFAGSVALAQGSYQHERLINLPGASAVLKSNSNALLAGGRLRAAYDIPFAGWYLRPMGDLDVYYTHTPRFNETDSSIYALAIGPSSKLNVAFTPAIELGSRIDLNRRLIMRVYADIGMSIIPDNQRSVSSRFADALSEDGTFTTKLKSPDVTGNLNLGVQLYEASGFDVRAEYNLRGGDRFLSQGGSLRLGYRF
jgi:hypothetical protein